MELVKRLSASSILLGISFGLRFTFTIVLAKYLSVSELGVYSWVVTIFGFATIFTNFGCDFFLLRKIPEYKNSLNDLVGSTLGHTQRKSLINTIIVIVTVQVGCILYYYFKSESDYGVALTLIIFALPFAAFSLIFSTCLRVFGFPLLGQFIESIVQTLILLIGLLFLYFFSDNFILLDRNVNSVVWIFLVSWFFSWLLSFLMFRQKVKLRNFLSSSDQNTKKWNKEQNSIVSGIMAGSLLGRSDIFILGFLVSPADVGTYFISLRLAEVLMFVTTVCYYTWGGELSNLIHENKIEQAKHVLKRSSQLSFSVTLVLGCFGFIFAEEILGIVNYRYVENANLLRIALCIFLIKGVSGLMRPLFYVLGEQRLMEKLNWMIGLTFAALILIFVPFFGLIGCLISFGLCELLFFIILVVKLNKKYGFSILPI
jgi:O-antigen/teichoic acid export membrane protein